DRGLRAGTAREPRPALHAVLAGADRTTRHRAGPRQAGSVSVATLKNDHQHVLEPPARQPGRARERRGHDDQHAHLHLHVLYLGVVTGCSSGPPFPSDGSSGPPSSLQLNDIFPSAPAMTRCASAGMKLSNGRGGGTCAVVTLVSICGGVGSGKRSTDAAEYSPRSG